MKRLKSCVRLAHLCIGLLASVYAIAIGLSGSLLVFRDNLMALEHPEFHRGRAIENRVTAGDALRAVQVAYPEWKALTVTWPNERWPYWMIYLQRGSEALQVYVDTGTGAVVGSIDPKRGRAGWLARVHVNLLAGRIGRRLNGYGALALLALSLSGPFLWWPKRGHWTHLHYSVGIGSAAFIATLAFTGAYFNWTQAYIAAVDRIFDRTSEPRAANRGGSLLPLEELARLAQRVFPQRSLYRIQVVDGAGQAVRVTVREGTIDEFHKVSTVFLDPVTGAVLGTVPLSGRPAGDTLLGLLSAVHFGVFGGWPVKILWAALSLSLPVLSVTGCCLWWRRVIAPRNPRPYGTGL